MKELLILLCQYPFDQSNRDRLKLLIREVKDWTTTSKLINSHGIIALAAYNIKEGGLEKELPVNAMAFLENGYMQSVARNAWLAERWKEVNSILSNAGIKHILLKGMALEHTLYGSKGLRQMNDNDILVRPGDSMRAWQLLVREGYSPETVKSPLFRKILFEIGHHLPALYKEGYMIEIHDRLTNNKSEEGSLINDAFANAEEILLDGQNAYCMPEKIHLRYLIDHFEHHKLSGDCQLRLYTDIVLLDRNSNIELPDRFIADPMQGNKPVFRKRSYKERIKSIPPKHRLRFIIGDTFPSVKWMKKRYRCNGFRALLLYPFRTGKLVWLL